MPPAADPPTPAEAARTLDELAAIRGRSSRLVYAAFTRGPLIAWGTAWMIGYAALDLLPWSAAVPLGCALSLAAVAGTWAARSREVVSGGQRRVRLSWLVLMACSPALVVVAGPLPGDRVVLLLGALWGIALLLLAVATGDGALAAVGLLIVVAAPVVRPLAPAHALLAFGVVAGGAMVALGSVRTWRSR